MSVMDSIEEKYQQEIAALIESRDEWKRQWRLMEAAEKKAEEQIAALEKTATEQDNCILHFQARVAALKAEIERLKFGREPLPCPRADK